MSRDNVHKEPDAAGREVLVDYVGKLQTIQKAKAAANSLRDKAATISDPQERERLFKEAYAKETEANGLSKVAQRMQSGPWQGFAGGAGIGSVVGLGLGGVVGTLLGGVLAIPTAGLGALIGTGVGAVHGPFIKVGGKDKRWDEASPDEVVDALEQQPELLNVEEEGDGQTGKENSSKMPESPLAELVPRRRPRKLEIRSHNRKNGEQTLSNPHGETSYKVFSNNVNSDNVTSRSMKSADGNKSNANRARTPRKLERRSQGTSNPTLNSPM